MVLVARRAPELEAAAAEIRAEGGDALALAGDVANADDVERVTAGAVERYGTLDILVNNAGVIGPMAPIWEIAVADWQESVDVNLTGVWLCCREAVKVMKEKQSGKIIYIGSMKLTKDTRTRTMSAPITRRTTYKARSASPHWPRRPSFPARWSA